VILIGIPLNAKMEILLLVICNYKKKKKKKKKKIIKILYLFQNIIIDTEIYINLNRNL